MKFYIFCCLAMAFLQPAFFATSASCVAQTGPEPETETEVAKTATLPDAETVIERCILASGGYEVLGSERSYRMVFDGTSRSQEDFDYESLKCEGKHYCKFDFDSGRVFERGCVFDARTATAKAIKAIAWTIDNGRVRELHGDEKQNYVRGLATVSLDFEMADRCVSAKCVAKEIVNGTDVYKLEIVSHDGTEFEKYFDVNTGLVVRTVRFHKSAVGSDSSERKKAVRDFMDYKQVGERVFPGRQQSTNRGKTWFYNLKTFESNVAIPEYRFVVPDELADRVAKFSAELNSPDSKEVHRVADR